MRNKRFLFFVGIFLLSVFNFAGRAWAANSMLDHESVTMTSRFEVFEDKTGKLDLRTILNNPQTVPFKPLIGELSESYTSSVFWLRFSLQKSYADSASLWWLEIRPSMLDDLRLYALKPNGEFSEQDAGDLRPFSEQKFQHRVPLFDVKLEGQEPHVFYLRVAGNNALFLNAKLYTPEQFVDESNRISNLLGIYYGVMIAMLIFNLMILVRIHDQSMMYYLFFCGSVLILSLSMNGHFAEYFSRDWVWLVNILPPAMTLVGLTFYSLFISHF